MLSLLGVKAGLLQQGILVGFRKSVNLSTKHVNVTFDALVLTAGTTYHEGTFLNVSLVTICYI